KAEQLSVNSTNRHYADWNINRYFFGRQNRNRPQTDHRKRSGISPLFFHHFSNGYFDNHHISDIGFWRIVTETFGTELSECHCQSHGVTDEFYLKNNRTVCLVTDQNHR